MSLVGLFLNTNQSFKMTFPTIREQRIGCAPDCGIRISYQHMQQRTQPGLPLSSFLISLLREDVAESIVAWYGHTYSASRLPTQTLNAIEDAIPARCSHLNGQNKSKNRNKPSKHFPRLEVFSSVFGALRQNWAKNSNKNFGRPNNEITPRIIAPYLYQ